jgi:5'-3' exonuclease
LILDIIDDFVLIMTFFGNDFLPSLLNYDFRHDKLDQIIRSYQSFLRRGKGFILDKKKEIVWENFIEFLECNQVYEKCTTLDKLE